VPYSGSWTKGTVFAKMKDIITVNGCEAQDETYHLNGERSDVFRSKFVLAPASACANTSALKITRSSLKIGVRNLTRCI